MLTERFRLGFSLLCSGNSVAGADHHGNIAFQKTKDDACSFLKCCRGPCMHTVSFLAACRRTNKLYHISGSSSRTRKSFSCTRHLVNMDLMGAITYICRSAWNATASRDRSKLPGHPTVAGRLFTTCCTKEGSNFWKPNLKKCRISPIG